MKSTDMYLKCLFFAFIALIISACSDEDIFTVGGEDVDITFRPTISAGLHSRDIGDATSINQLVVAVYEGSGDVLSKTFSYSEDWDVVQRNGITLKLIGGRAYKIIFWAQNSKNSAYELTEDGNIAVNYADYVDGGFAKMEELDAFYTIQEISIESNNNVQKNITLTRPFAQLNFADKTTKPEAGVHKAVVKFYNIPKSFNPFDGTIINAGPAEDNVSFTFTDFPGTEFLNVDGESYNYVSSNYLFAPTEGTTKIEASLDLQNIDGTPINAFEFRGEDAIILEKNKKTNVLGSIVHLPETWSVWGGNIPTECTLGTDPENPNRYIIDEADDIAWLSVKENAQNLNQNSAFVVTVDVDMDNKSGLESIQLPQGSTLDGGGHTIKGLTLDGGLLGNVTNVSVRDLTIDESTILNSNTAVTHIGVLVNTLSGSATFTNVTIMNSSVSTSNGAAGGMIGYISRIDKDMRTETLNVTFDNCHVTETTVDGTKGEGHFVGLLRGYDNDEILQFNGNCTLTLSATATHADELDSFYREGNEGAWLADNDYSKYDGWLGNEECYRGTVMYGGKRFIPCWDGVTKITPLTEGTTKLIYSAFDLASLQDSGAGNIKLMENVCMEYDLDGASKDGERDHIFTALSTLTELDGNGKTIYNITIRDNYYGGFVKSDNCATTFKNVTFDGADIRVTHDSSTGNAYVGTLRGLAYAKTIINNVNVKNGYLYGVNKMGGLCGAVFDELDCENSIVDNYIIENQEVLIKDAIFAISTYEIGFYPHGEVGGLIGFIAANSGIENCCVTNTTFKCVGVKDMSWFENSKIPGRHINQFIGDIRTTSGQIIRIDGCSVNNNKFESQTFSNNDSESKLTNFSWYYTLKNPASSSRFLLISSCTYTNNKVSPEVDLVGCCYYIYCEVYAIFGTMHKKMADTKGQLWIDGTQKF